MVGLGLFAPLPLAVMIPFMAGQSFAMGEAFGKGFQYGKRRVSSMTNEEFNASSGPQMFAETTADITAMIPTMKNAMEKFHTLQTDIILKMIDYIAKLPAEAIPAIAQGVSQVDWLEIIKTVTQAGGNISEDLIKSILKGVPEAHASLAPTIVQTPFTSDNIKLQNEINRLKENIKTDTRGNVVKIEGNIKTTTTPGGQIKVEVVDQSKIKTVVTPSIVKTFTAPTKPRAPKSIVIQIRKFDEELKALGVRMNQTNHPVTKQNIRSLIMKVIAKKNDLLRRYQF